METFVSSIALGTAPNESIIDGGAAGSIGSSVLPITPLDHSSESGEAPRAYLNYIVFNKTMTTVLDYGDLNGYNEKSMKCIKWNLIPIVLFVTLTGYSFDRCKKTQADTCVAAIVKDRTGASWSIGYNDGVLQLSHGTVVKFISPQQNFSSCLDFSYRGLYIKTGDNNWELRNYWMDEKLLFITALDEMGRCMLFTFDLVNGSLLRGEKNGDDFLMSRFNKVYFDSDNLLIAIAGDYEEDYNTNEIKTNIYYSKISSEKTIRFVKIKQLKEIDHNTILTPVNLF